jgi:hypothetical protein
MMVAQSCARVVVSTKKHPENKQTSRPTAITMTMWWLSSASFDMSVSTNDGV